MSQCMTPPNNREQNGLLEINKRQKGLHMRETVKTRFQLKTGIMFVAALMMVVLVTGMTTIISHAEEGRVTASSAKIRAGADTGSEMIGSALQGEVYTITGEVADADGVHTWYQITFEENRTGYVRSDLMQKVGSGGASTPSTPTAPTTPASTVVGEVTALQPVSAKVTGEQVRVRSNASTSGSIVSTVQRDVVLTVVGMAKDSEQKTWYQVNFSDATGQKSGFVREDFVSLEGELIPADQVPEEPEPVVTDPVDPVSTPEPVPVHKDYETQQYDGVWYLADYAQDQMYPISELFTAGTTNKELYEEAQAKLKSTKLIMIILVVLVVVLALATTLLFFKVRDMMDAAYFEEVEKETMRKRQGQKSPGRASMPTVGAGGRTSGSSGQRPSGSSGQKPSGSGQKPSGGSSQQRLAGSGQPRPSGSSGQRPAGSGQQRPAGSGQQARPAGGQSHSGQQSRSASRDTQSGSKQSRNFMADDDEFDFEYLNWDGEEDN